MRIQPALLLDCVFETEVPVRRRIESCAGRGEKQRRKPVIGLQREDAVVEARFAMDSVIRVHETVVVAAGDERAKLELHITIGFEDFIKNDGGVLAVNRGDRLSQSHTARGIFESRKEMLLERHQVFEAARMNRSGKLI